MMKVKKGKRRTYKMGENIHQVFLSYSDSSPSKSNSLDERIPNENNLHERTDARIQGSDCPSNDLDESLSKDDSQPQSDLSPSKEEHKSDMEESRMDTVNTSEDKISDDQEIESKEIVKRSSCEHIGRMCRFIPKCTLGNMCKFQHPVCKVNKR